MFALSEEYISLISLFKIIAVLLFEGDMINISEVFTNSEVQTMPLPTVIFLCF